jgi:hypothetical protein
MSSPILIEKNKEKSANKLGEVKQKEFKNSSFTSIMDKAGQNFSNNSYLKNVAALKSKNISIIFEKQEDSMCASEKTNFISSFINDTSMYSRSRNANKSNSILSGKLSPVNLNFFKKKAIIHES